MRRLPVRLSILAVLGSLLAAPLVAQSVIGYWADTQGGS